MPPCWVALQPQPVPAHSPYWHPQGLGWPPCGFTPALGTLGAPVGAPVGARMAADLNWWRWWFGWSDSGTITLPSTSTSRNNNSFNTSERPKVIAFTLIKFDRKSRRTLWVSLWRVSIFTDKGKWLCVLYLFVENPPSLTFPNFLHQIPCFHLWIE